MIGNAVGQTLIYYLLQHQIVQKVLCEHFPCIIDNTHGVQFFHSWTIFAANLLFKGSYLERKMIPLLGAFPLIQPHLLLLYGSDIRQHI